MEEKISVIIPVFNAEKFIGEAIESVLGQTIKPSQLIVVNDGSTDGSEAVIRSYNEVEYHAKNNGGVSSAINLAIQKTTGNYIAFLDADDVWVSGKLEWQLKYFRNNPTVDGVFGFHKRFYNKPTGELTDEEAEDAARVLPGRFKAGLLIRKDSYLTVGDFDESITMGDFLDWYRRAMDKGMQFGMVEKVVFHRRIHGANTSLKEKAQIGDYARLLKASLDRRRKSGEI